MSEKTRYFKIGLFTLGALGLLCVGLLIFGASSYFDEPPILAETYFLQSVQGLDVGAPVKFSGVQVGKVKNIRFIKDEYKHEKSLKDLADHYKKVIVVFELETKYFLDIKNKNLKKKQASVNYMVEEHALRVKMVGIGITGPSLSRAQIASIVSGISQALLWADSQRSGSPQAYFRSGEVSP